MPPDPGVIIHIGDLAEAIPENSDEYGDWLRFLADERILAELESSAEEHGLNLEVFEIIAELADLVRGGSIALMDLEQGAVVGALDTEEDFQATLMEALETAGERFVETELFGLSALSDGGPGEWTTAIVEVEGMSLFVAGGLDGEAEALLEDMLERVQEGKATGGAWSALAEDRPESELLGAYFDVQALESDDPESEAVEDYVDAFYLGL